MAQIGSQPALANCYVFFTFFRVIFYVFSTFFRFRAKTFLTFLTFFHPKTSNRKKIKKNFSTFFQSTYICSYIHIYIYIFYIWINKGKGKRFGIVLGLLCKLWRNRFGWVPYGDLAEYSDFRTFPINLICYYINVPHNQFIQIDMTFNFIFRQGLPGKCLYKSNNKNDEMVLRTISLFVWYFYSYRALYKRALPHPSPLPAAPPRPQPPSHPPTLRSRSVRAQSVQTMNDVTPNVDLKNYPSGREID